MNPPRIGNTDSALMVITPPTICETSGVMSVNWQVSVTWAGSPRSVPALNTGVGRVPGSTQFSALASARIWAS